MKLLQSEKIIVVPNFVCMKKCFETGCDEKLIQASKIPVTGCYNGILEDPLWMLL